MSRCILILSLLCCGCPRPTSPYEVWRQEAARQYEAMRGDLRANSDLLRRELEVLRSDRTKSEEASRRLFEDLGRELRGLSRALSRRGEAVREGAASRGDGRFVVSRDALLDRAGELLGAFAALAPRQEGQVRGIAVLSDHPSLESFGLRMGDLLLRLGDIRLETIGMLVVALRTTRSGEVSLDLQRDGRLVRFWYDVRR
jgi:hypothetical protein